MKRQRRKSIINSDPGKILDLVLLLTDDSCAMLQTKVNQYTSTKMTEVIKNNQEQVDYLCNFPGDFQQIVVPILTKDNPKRRVVLYPVVDRQFSLIVCVIAPGIIEEFVGRITHECVLFCWPTLKKSIALEYECSLKQKCQQLLRVAKRLFTQVASLDTLLAIAIEQVKLLTKAEHCSVLLIDVERMELVQSSYSTSKPESKIERRFAIDLGLSGLVIKTGSLINAKNLKDYPAFDPQVDGLPDVECNTILCFPIREQTGIIGVGLLINKVGDPYFDAMDEEMALAFSIYCGACIMHSVIYQKIQEAHIRNALANELVMYHMKVSDTELSRMLNCTGFHTHPHISNLHFNPRVLPHKELACYSMKMYSDLGFITKSTTASTFINRLCLKPRFNLKRTKLARFILYAKKGYRDVPYHNFMHGFSVAQWAFAAITNYKLVGQGFFSDLQALMYLVAGLTHDLDHRGTTNSFQVQGQTTLAALYSSEGSVMERHHLAQAMCILNTEGCDMLDVLPRRDYDRAIIMLRDYILATDLANYFKNLGEYKLIANDFNKGNKIHISALQCLLMNAADLSDQLKDWGCIKKTASAVLTEFFKQGDVEKSRGDLPLTIMDREKCFIPDLEIQFIKNICVPLFVTLSKILPRAEPCIKILEAHVERWEAAKPVFAEVPITAGLSVLLSPELDNLIDQNLKEKERLRQQEEAETEEA